MSSLSLQLELLEARGLVRLTLEQERPVVRFKHALTREATYNSILQTRRTELHHAVARALAALFPQPDLELTLTLADHWKRGGQDAQALETLLPRAQALIFTGRGATLSGLLTRLERKALSAPQQRELDLALADAAAARGENEPARELYELVLPYAQDPPRRARILHSLGSCYYHLGDYAHALEALQASYALAKELGDSARQASAAGGLGLTYLSRGDLANAELFFEQSRAQSAQVGNSLELANAEHNLGLLFMQRGEYARAIEFAERALALDRELGHIALVARTLQLLGACYHLQGDVAHAESYYRQGIEMSRKLGDQSGIANGLTNLAELYAQRDELDRARETYQEAIRLFEELGIESFLAYTLVGLADLETRRARRAREAAAHAQALASAIENVERAARLAEKIKAPEREGMVERVRAEIYRERDEPRQARYHAQRAVELLERGGMARELQLALRTYGEILKASSDPGERAQGAQLLERANSAPT